MRKITDLLNDFSIDSISTMIADCPKCLEEFGYKIKRETKIENIQVIEKDYYQKYFGNLYCSFVLLLKREFLLKVGGQSLGYLVYEGRYRLINKGNHEFTCRPNHEEYENSNNIFGNFDKFENSKVQIYPGIENFFPEGLPK